MKSDELKRLLELHNLIKKNENILFEIDEKLTSIKSTSDFTTLPNTGGKENYKNESLFDYKDLVSKRINEYILEYEDLKHKLINNCVKISDEDIKDIILLRYLFNFSFKQISKYINYSESAIYKKYNQGINILINK